MRRLTALTLVGLASLSLSGCGFFGSLFGRGPDEPSIEPENMPLPNEPGDQAQGEDFVEPLVPAAPSAAAIASAELIQSTDPNERLQQIARSRPDPFATVPIPPRPRAVPRPANRPQGQTAGRPGGGTGAGSAGNVAGRPGGTAAGGSVNGGTASGVNPGGTAGGGGGSSIQPLPSLPQPQFATTVAVTGVVRVGGESYAIIKAPNESTSRHVKVGQRLVNGQVLVKRIELRGGEEPVVILEENGIEVARPVGSGGESEQAPTAAAGAAPQALVIPPLPQS
jgi:hypothetical protein